MNLEIQNNQQRISDFNCGLIKQIIAATDWYALYKTESEGYKVQPLAAWSLTTTPSGAAMRGIYAEYDIDFVDESSASFVRYAHASELPHLISEDQ